MISQESKDVIGKNQLGIRICRFVDDTKRVRFVIQDRDSLKPSISASIYEASLTKKHTSHNTVYDAIQKLSYIYEWSKQNDINLDEIFLTGEALSVQQINSFSNWLDERSNRNSKIVLSNKTINSIIDRTSIASRWFIDQFGKVPGTAIERETMLGVYKDHVMKRFSDKNRKVIIKKSADDLSDQEISLIESFLLPESRIENNPKMHKGQVIRDYLIWRLIYEFGLRQSEVLALRLEDCPHQYQNYIKIVRIEERGRDYYDKRGAYAPRPKTLTRDLGFLFDNSPIKRLINEYTTKYRKRKTKEHGIKKYSFILDNPAFLILSHKNDLGDPLSISAMQDIAKLVRDETGIESFHWHLVRHAFFNRRYAEAMKMKETDNEAYVERIKDLVNWGGWEDENSLQMYINKARRDRAINILQSQYE